MTHEEDNDIAALLRFAGGRDMPSTSAMARARAAAEAAWRTGLRDEPARRARWSRPFGWALAAGLVALAMGAAWYWRSPVDVPVAHVAVVRGHALWRGDADAAPAPGETVLSGATLETADGRVSLALGTLSLRVDHHSRLRFDAPERVTLLAGSVYVDSGGVNALAALRIVTPAGAVRHLGTQFQVTVDGALTRIQVREGRVALDGTVAREVAAGENLEVRGTTVVMTRAPSTSDGAWQWTAIAAPVLDIENRPLAEFLAWIAREHGWQLRYADAEAQTRAQNVRLHGSLAGLDVDGMLERVSLITGMSLVERDGALAVGGVAP